MNNRMIARILGTVLLCLAGLLLLPLLTAIIYKEPVTGFLITILLSALLGIGLLMLKPKRTDIYAKEGLVCVGLSWVLMSMLGALPFVISGDIPFYVDALFETCSGFTTTGASILTDVEAMSRSCLFWRMGTSALSALKFAKTVNPTNTPNIAK